MPLYNQDKYYDEIRKLAWLEAVKFFGNQRKLAVFVGVEQSTINKWINKPKRSIYYDKVLLVAQKTKISIDRLLPNNPMNKHFINGINKLPLQDLFINKIIVTNSRYIPYKIPNRHIITSSNGLLISGLAELKSLKNANILKTQGIILNLEGLLLGLICIEDLLPEFIFSEIMEIGCVLRQLLVNAQIEGNHDQIIAKFIGMSHELYCISRQIFINGSQELIKALNNKQISIARAATIAKFAKNEQTKFIHQSLIKEKHHVELNI